MFTTVKCIHLFDMVNEIVCIYKMKLWSSSKKTNDKLCAPRKHSFVKFVEVKKIYKSVKSNDLIHSSMPIMLLIFSMVKLHHSRQMP